MLDAQPVDEGVLLARIGEAARSLVSMDDWLPPGAAVPHPQFYQQYLLYCDPSERFSVVSFVWGPGQKTPIHDHMTWGVIAMLRGAERGERFAIGAPMTSLGVTILRRGDVEYVSPKIGDIHEVSNVFSDAVSVSIHVYGGNIGRIARHVFEAGTGASKEFLSGYANVDQALHGYTSFPSS
ncbi:cysteine dioxygenase [Paraburkholderia bengalensis]|uniref:cysteine dioxygenase family protein n=1 Tax=Paraburkholderia bengalensis TaxID=2747562 RepID=UPI003AF6C824